MFMYDLKTCMWVRWHATYNTYTSIPLYHQLIHLVDRPRSPPLPWTRHCGGFAPQSLPVVSWRFQLRFIVSGKLVGPSASAYWTSLSSVTGTRSFYGLKRWWFTYIWCSPRYSYIFNFCKYIYIHTFKGKTVRCSPGFLLTVQKRSI